MAIRVMALHPSRFKNIRTIFFANLIWGLCSGFYNVILQPFLVDYIDSEFMFGVIMTVANLAQLIPMILVSEVSDRVGRKRVYLAGLFLYIPAMVLFAISSIVSIALPLFLIISGLLLVNLGFGVSDPALVALTAESSDEDKKASSFSFIFIAIYASGLVGPIIIRIFANQIPIYYYFYGLIGGYTFMFLYQLFRLKESFVIEDFTTNFWKQFFQSMKALGQVIIQFFVSILRFLIMPFLLIFRYSSEKTERSQLLRNVKRDMRLVGDIFKTKGVKFAIGYFIFDSFVFGLSLNIYNGAVKYAYAYTESHIATMQLVMSLSTIIFFIPLTKISDKLKRKEMLMMSQLAGSLFFTTNIIAHFTLPEYRLYVILIGWAGLGASIAFWVPSILSILTDFDKRRRAEVYGMVTGIKGLGWLPTGIIAGFIIEKTIDTMGLLVPFIISIILYPLLLFLTMKFPEADKSKNKSIDESIKKADEDVQYN
ncbi:MAG: MFS transporter [Candidatus Heimdallarchaeota archaeon]|nr:MFS transporter [Candidatus Heimdallarchaeota archaeon]